MTADLTIFCAVLSVACGGTAFIIWLAEDAIPTWWRRIQVQRAKRAARRQDVIDMARWRAVRRIGAGR